ncbi:Uu.00g104070.m01.CDS01 [Anthostomella pinea]|uniref:Uu.00g104070.m01.CDS01 n=1 Tax=Anthostomella pinea TaxID=933095 RepID=A0AAI8YFK2_9PEZI|nr:Uu.00g104070.m01.CDS01 [Anthostomella pinea]
MSSGPSNLGGKLLSAPTSYIPSSQPISTPQPSFESGSRRSGPSSPSLPSSAPRKGQGSRKQHRNQRRPLRDVGNLDDDDAMAEIRAVRNASSRRGQTSITHLLNYSVPTRHYHEQSRSSRRHPTWGPGSGYHAIDKARFVHANYRFVVSPTGDYTPQAADADKHLEWSDVLQILASAESQTTSCPICLSEPVAPRMARCGHIFCLPCLLRFMNSTNDDEPSSRREARWKKCPICEDSFRLSEVRPVRFYAGQENPFPRVGEDVVLRLMVREAGSTLAVPNEGGADVVNLGEDVPWHFAASVMDYARVMKGTHDYIAQQYDREVEELRHQAVMDECQFGVDEGDWTQRAIRAINTARDKIKEQNEGVETLVRPSTLKAKHPAGHKFHFYTAPPHLYLSPLDIRILKTKFGDFSDFPSTLLPRVEHISTGHVVDDALRKRAKYLGHLPQGCVVSFLECDWTDIVPADILEVFSNDLERRRKAHSDKAAQEDRERLQAERLEAAAIGRTTRRHFENANEDKFETSPAMNAEDFQPLSSVAGTTPPNPRAGFGQLAGLSTSPSTSRTVWGTTVISTSPTLDTVQERDADDGWLKDNDFVGAAEIAMQMEAFGIDSASPGPSSNPGAPSGGGGGGKKKKKQKITLMSTGGRRGN